MLKKTTHSQVKASQKCSKCGVKASIVVTSKDGKTFCITCAEEDNILDIPTKENADDN